MKRVSSVKAFSFILLLAALGLFPEGIRGFAAETEDGEYEAVAEEYIKGYLGAHPLEGTALGFMNMMVKSLTTAASRSMPSFRGYGASTIG